MSKNLKVNQIRRFAENADSYEDKISVLSRIIKSEEYIDDDLYWDQVIQETKEFVDYVIEQVLEA